MDSQYHVIQKFLRMTSKYRNFQMNVQQNFMNSILNMTEQAIKLGYKELSILQIQ